MIFALVGNQNSGKTTLFNQLTGSNQHVGQFPWCIRGKPSRARFASQGVSVVDLWNLFTVSE
jgi:ferrous iron transport protein B